MNQPRTWRNDKVDVVLSAVIFLSVALLYWPVRKFSWINFDDPQYVFQNAQVLKGLNFQTFKQAWTLHAWAMWQPLTILSYLLDVRWFGPTPGPMHLENVLLHGAGCVACYFLLRDLTALKVESGFVAAFLAVHPAHVESVAWISERKDVLSALLMLLSLICYVRYTHGRGFFRYWISLLLFALALLAKVSVVVQPLLMFLLDYWPLRRFKVTHGDTESPDFPDRSIVIEKLPFLLLAIAVGLINIHTQSATGATPDLVQLSVRDRVATACVGFFRYLVTAFFPRRLSVFYPYEFGIPLIAVFSAILLIVFSTFVLWRLRKSRPYLLVGIGWYFFSLLPVIGLTQAGDQSIADRYTYLPFIGLSIAVVWTCSDLNRQGRGSRQTAFGIVAVVSGLIALAACGWVTTTYLPCWSDTISLFKHAEEVNAPDWKIESHLADGYVDKNQIDQALDHYQLALLLKNDLPGTHINLANLLMRYSTQLALPHYETAIRLAPGNAVAHYDYAVCLSALKRDAEANHEFNVAQSLGITTSPH